jgi:hypothetical protein
MYVDRATRYYNSLINFDFWETNSIAAKERSDIERSARELPHMHRRSADVLDTNTAFIATAGRERSVSGVEERIKTGNEENKIVYGIGDLSKSWLRE